MAAHQTPRHRLQRPSYSNIGSGEKNAFLSASTNVNRKASLQALTGYPRTPPANMADDILDVGDVVNVPGEMFGTVRFVGTVRGKAGKFVGVELDAEFAARGKNNGDVDGISYFATNVPGSGIFLPTHRAEKRSSPTFSSDAYPSTPATPSHSTLNGQRTKATPTTPGGNTKFVQSVGPGAQRPSSPQFKPKRPSLPRPESPLRKPPPNLQPTPARPGFSQSVRGARPPVTNTPSRNNLRASTNTRGAGATPARPGSRNGSRLGNRQETTIDEDRPRTAGRRPSNGVVPAYGQANRSPSRLGSAGSQDAEVQRLKKELSERDRRLDEQAASLAEMEASVKELSAIMPIDVPPPQHTPSHGSPQTDDATVMQLRQMVREKNDKIGSLTAEFDTHRADFRSTLDSLEMASAETERVYEEQKGDLLQQVAELQELNQQSQDFEAVAAQLRQLEELVAELEEGLEESRRGEAEARGEVEFLRGEVERGRSELRREREKAAAVLKYTESGRNSINPKEMEEKDDEILGLKAIIKRMSADTTSSGVNGIGHMADPDEVKKLQAIVEETRVEKEELEREIEQLRRDAATTNGNGFTHSRQESEMTTLGAAGRPRGDTMKATFAEHARRSGMDDNPAHQVNGSATGTDPIELSGIYCEMCGSDNHDTLDCTDLLHPQALSTSRKPSAVNGVSGSGGGDSGRDHSPGKENEYGLNGGAGTKGGASPLITGNGDAEKWCALCEKDGHLAYDCPEEQF